MRVIIAGAGNVGGYIARELVAGGHEVVLVEIDQDRVAHAQVHETVPGVRWLAADACEVSELAVAHPEQADVVVAVTGDDEDNLVISLLAKQEFGVPRVVARVNNPGNQWLFDESWGVDVSVSTPHLLTALVEEAVSVGSLVRLLSLAGDRAALEEVRLAPESPACGRTTAQLALPGGCAVTAVIRGDQVLVPDDLVLDAGDELVVLVARGAEDRVRAALVG